MKPSIIAIVGESGSGKTTVADYLERAYKIPMILSYTDRPRRTPDEKGHKFVSKEEYDNFKLEDMIAHTQFGNARYCCLKQDVQKVNSYVIDEDGLDYLVNNFSNDYTIYKLRIFRDRDLRLKSGIELERINRDFGGFKKRPREYHYVIVNDKTPKYLERKIEWFMLNVVGVNPLPLNYGNDR
jgi:guanylate kinase